MIDMLIVKICNQINCKELHSRILILFENKEKLKFVRNNLKNYVKLSKRMQNFSEK